jgi:hypothetical protein
MQKFVDQTDGRDLDYDKVRKQLLKQQDPTECPPG